MPRKRETSFPLLQSPRGFAVHFSGFPRSLAGTVKNGQLHRLIDQSLSYRQGDPNVPEGKLTFEVDLTRPLSEDNSEPGEGKRSFMLSNAIEARFKDFPPTYRARYVIRFLVPGSNSLHLIYLLP